jgi:hypothetical protein
MKHQPYESWIFTQEDLELDQAKELRIHLKLCDRCAQLAEALSDVETRFSSQELISPTDGFSSRWRERLEQKKRISFRRQTSILFGGLSIGAAVLFIPVLIGGVLTVFSSGNMLTNFVQEFVNWLAVINFTSDVTAGVLDGMADTIPAFWWFTLALFSIGLFVLWMFMIHRVRPKQAVRNGIEANDF